MDPAIKGRRAARLLVFVVLAAARHSTRAAVVEEEPAGALRLKPPPPGYVACRCAERPEIDGRLGDACWAAAAWTAEFVDIRGPAAPRPWFSTRAKMAWDDWALYVGAELEEPRAFANQTLHDSVIFRDNDFEVFIDPDGDNTNYFELEVNALGTVWDLLLPRPYRNGGPPVHSWESVPPATPTAEDGPTGWEPMRVAVHVDGQVNAAAGSRGWSVEAALPWTLLRQAAGGRRAPPAAGDQWRINFSRVQWNATWSEDLGTYVKEPAEQAESNWVWSPQWQVNMHQPESWGYVQFSDTPAPLPACGAVGPQQGSCTAAAAAEFTRDPTWPARALLMDVYHAQGACWKARRRYCGSLAELGLDGVDAALAARTRVEVTSVSFVATASVPLSGGGSAVVLVDQLGRLVQYALAADGSPVGGAYDPADGCSRWPEGPRQQQQ